MKITRQITIETYRITITRTSGRSGSAHCEGCGKTVKTFAHKKIADDLRHSLEGKEN